MEPERIIPWLTVACLTLGALILLKALLFASQVAPKLTKGADDFAGSGRLLREEIPKISNHARSTVTKGALATAAIGTMAILVYGGKKAYDYHNRPWWKKL